MGKKKNCQRHPRMSMAELRFAVIGSLLASPPRGHGTLKHAFHMLTFKDFVHPVTHEKCRFAFSTIERWYYQALRANNPTERLARVMRKKKKRNLDLNMVAAWGNLYRDHPSWTIFLLYKNLCDSYALRELDIKIPSYSTFCRLYHDKGWMRLKKPRTRPDGTPLEASVRALLRKKNIEIRSYEAQYVGELWHLDFHVCSRDILLSDGTYTKPKMFAVIDDKSRIIAHAQWYLSESTENLVHGLIQAFCKRGLPRKIMTDNGSAMKGAEFIRGLQKLSIFHEPTLEYSPYQNGKQERWWSTLESQLIAMLENVRNLTLIQLNRQTLEWIELSYHNSIHSEIRMTPMDAFLNQPESVLRDCNSIEMLDQSFMQLIARKQRKTDGTISVDAVRYEIPSAYRHLFKCSIIYPSWNLSNVYLVDAVTEKVIHAIYPLNKTKNSDQKRMHHSPIVNDIPLEELPPTLQKLRIKRNKACLEVPYLPKEELCSE